MVVPRVWAWCNLSRSNSSLGQLLLRLVHRQFAAAAGASGGGDDSQRRLCAIGLELPCNQADVREHSQSAIGEIPLFSRGVKLPSHLKRLCRLP